MTNIQLIETCTIAEYFICAIEYNDTSGLMDEEEIQLEDWLENYPRCMFEYGDSSEFAKCEITGLMSDCVEVKIYKDQS
jgi:hypothetical protein